jgi:nuclear transport factor 2 (NTF2) superfamily protein
MIMDTEKKTFVLVHGAWHGGWFRAYGNEQWEFYEWPDASPRRKHQRCAYSRL